MSALFGLVISVCALTGECSDVLIGVYQSESFCQAAAKEQNVKGLCLPYKSADDQQPAASF